MVESPNRDIKTHSMAVKGPDSNEPNINAMSVATIEAAHTTARCHDCTSREVHLEERPTASAFW